jgi:hypothetical protein
MCFARPNRSEIKHQIVIIFIIIRYLIIIIIPNIIIIIIIIIIISGLHIDSIFYLTIINHY